MDTPTEDVDGQIEGLSRDEHVLKSIAEFISRPSEKSSLRILHIYSLRISGNLQLMEVLKAVPSLHTLDRCNVAVGDDDVLGSLSSIVSGAPPVCLGPSPTNIVWPVPPEDRPDLSITPSSQAFAGS
ncbi:uncharacterized protein EI90DRAFT_3151483 [Cantharellus anzutake]|uniref:uncharacterized protein n=1 Tax=Cantharellus anzutake TaxID=1750568 RepID=UPI001903A323|nr:uncharacterized protein EI90DRAFT_3151483 [Cantharellus anzutake]KAF8338832.1 hypothetical protein EI90DRAFT_3151483 [Cantharellus anzutake]